MRECAPYRASASLVANPAAPEACGHSLSAFRFPELPGVRPVIVFDLRRLVVASAAAVEDQDHEAAADHKGEEDAKPHHQPAPRRHRDIAGRDPSVMADIDRSSQEREKNTDNDKPQGHSSSSRTLLRTERPMDHLVPAPE